MCGNWPGKGGRSGRKGTSLSCDTEVLWASLGEVLSILNSYWCWCMSELLRTSEDQYFYRRLSLFFSGSAPLPSLLSFLVSLFFSVDTRNRDVFGVLNSCIYFFCINSHNQRESFPQTSYFYLLNMTEAFYFNHPLLCTGDWPDIALTYCVTRDLYIPMYFELLLWRVASLFSLFRFLKHLILQIFHFTVLRLMGAISNIKVFSTPILYVFYLNYSCLL